MEQRKTAHVLAERMDALEWADRRSTYLERRQAERDADTERRIAERREQHGTDR